MSHDMTKPTKWACTQRRHRSPESSLCTQWVAKDPSFLQADSEDSDQPGRMPRLIWVFAGRTFILLFCHVAAHMLMSLRLWCYLNVPWKSLHDIKLASKICTAQLAVGEVDGDHLNNLSSLKEHTQRRLDLSCTDAWWKLRNAWYPMSKPNFINSVFLNCFIKSFNILFSH